MVLFVGFAGLWGALTAGTPPAGAWAFEEDFTTYADNAAMTTAGYTLNANHNLDAANDEWDLIGNGNSEAGTALGFSLDDATEYTMEIDVVNFSAAPLRVRGNGGTPGAQTADISGGANGTNRFTFTTGTSNTSIQFDSNAATSLSLSGWRVAKTVDAPAP